MAWKTNLACLIKARKRRRFPVPESSSLPPVLNNICSQRKSTTPEKLVASVAACDTDGKESGSALDRLFSLEQQASILQVLNTASDKELEAFRLLRGRKSVNIVEHRKKFGPFQSLENLIDVPLIQYKTAVEVCNSILCPENRRRKKSQEKWLLRKFIKPEAMLYALLNKTFAEDGQHRVLSIYRNAVGKHFDLMIGDTRTSGRELVKQLLSESVLKKQPRVFFPQDLIVQYRQKIVKSSYWIEELYDSLLQAVAFYELVFDRGSELTC